MEPICRFTIRCEREDLPKLPAGVAEGIARKVQNRIDTNSVESGDRYLSVPVPKMHTEHQRAYRAVTWFDERSNVVWVCAVGYHYPEPDDQRDAYEVARRLAEEGRLLPSRTDYVSLEGYRIRVEIGRAQDAARQLRQQADAKGSASGYFHGSPVDVTRLGSNLYEIRFLHRIGLEQSLALIATVFPDHVDVDWVSPERGADGHLYQSVIILTG